MQRIKIAKALICVLVGIGTVQAQVGRGSVGPSIAAQQYSGQAANTNQLVLGVGVTALYDDNAFNTVQGEGQAEFGATPRISWDVTHSHWYSMLNYSANIMRSTRFDFYNRTSHSLDTTFGYQFNKNLSVAVQDNFVRSADPNYFVGALNPFLPGPGAPNPSYFGPPSVLTSNFVDASIQYRLDARSSFTVDGSFSLQRYSQVLNASLRNTNGTSGSASFRHEFSGRMSSGVTYDISKFTSPAGYSTLSQRILANEEITFRPDMKLSLFAGPNHVSNAFNVLGNGTVAQLTNSGWSWSAGGTFSWRVAKMNMTGSAIRQVSDGGGLTSTVQLTSFQYSVARDLPHKFSMGLRAGYTLNNNLFRIISANNSVNSNYGNAGATITRNLRRDLTASITYDRTEQMAGYLLGTPWIDRNRITIALNYSFTHPLGR